MNGNIAFTGKISRESVESLIFNLKSEIGRQRVWIDSPGGTFEFFSILGPPLRRFGFTGVAKNIHSAAIALYLLSHKRYALPDATFFFHEVRAIIGNNAITVCDLEDALSFEQRELEGKSREVVEEMRRNLANAQSWLLSFLCEQSRVSRSVFLDLMRSEVTLSAREALNYGIVQKIVTEDEFHMI